MNLGALVWKSMSKGDFFESNSPCSRECANRDVFSKYGCSSGGSSTSSRGNTSHHLTSNDSSGHILQKKKQENFSEKNFIDKLRKLKQQLQKSTATWFSTKQLTRAAKTFSLWKALVGLRNGWLFRRMCSCCK